MQNLINIKTENDRQLVDARELHTFLESKRNFADWIQQRIKKFGFIENEDYTRFHKFVKGDSKGYGNKTVTEYALTINMAKELAMVENNEKGREARRYFIAVEEGKDFLAIMLKSTGGRPKQDYALTLGMAKELAMVENNEKGREARRYFIAVEEGKDFTIISQNGEKMERGRPAKDYALTLNMAKELAMVENNEKGREARRYFIAVEEAYKKGQGFDIAAAPDIALLDAKIERPVIISILQQWRLSIQLKSLVCVQIVCK